MTDYTPQSWAQAFLARLGVTSPTKTEVDEVVAWEAAEGGNWNNDARYNPLNTSQPEPGSQNYQGGTAPGVQRYPSWSSGMDATVRTITYPAYTGVLAALKQPNNPGQFVAALKASPWDAGHYAGGFPTIGGVTYTGGGPNTSGVGNIGNPQGFGNADPNDWIATINHVLNPKVNGFSLNPLTDVTDVAKSLQLVAARGGVAFIGLVLLGTGLLLTFGRDIFGGAPLAIPFASTVADRLGGEGHAAHPADSVPTAPDPDVGKFPANRKAA